jgi:hypothetical protein
MSTRRIKFHRNPSTGSRADTFGRQMYKQTDMTKLILEAFFQDYANEPKKSRAEGGQNSNLEYAYFRNALLAILYPTSWAAMSIVNV